MWIKTSWYALHKSSKEFNDVCEVLYLHLSRVGTIAQAFQLSEEASVQQWDDVGWMMVMIVFAVLVVNQ